MYLAQKSLWCHFRENTIRECLIHVVMMRPHKVICVVGLSFNLSKGGKNTVEEEIPGVGCWYVWGREQDSSCIEISAVTWRIAEKMAVLSMPFQCLHLFFVSFCYLETPSSERTHSS